MLDLEFAPYDQEDHAHFDRCAKAIEAQRQAKLSLSGLALIMGAVSWPFMILAMFG